jgi:hypothetical protein
MNDSIVTDGGTDTATPTDGTTAGGVAQQLRDSPLDIVVLPVEESTDVFVKADEQVLLLDEMEAQTLAKEIQTKLQERNQ